MQPSVPPRPVGAVSARRVVTFVLYYCKDEASGVTLADVSVVLRYILYIYNYIYYCISTHLPLSPYACIFLVSTIPVIITLEMHDCTFFYYLLSIVVYREYLSSY